MIETKISSYDSYLDANDDMLEKTLDGWTLSDWKLRKDRDVLVLWQREVSEDDLLRRKFMHSAPYKTYREGDWIKVVNIKDFHISVKEFSIRAFRDTQSAIEKAVEYMEELNTRWSDEQIAEYKKRKGERVVRTEVPCSEDGKEWE